MLHSAQMSPDTFHTPYHHKSWKECGTKVMEIVVHNRLPSALLWNPRTKKVNRSDSFVASGRSRSKMASIRSFCPSATANRSFRWLTASCTTFSKFALSVVNTEYL